MENTTEKSNHKKIAIITGASAGLGKEYAKQIEQNYLLDEIWLIARRTDLMQAISANFKKAKGIALSLDLSNENNLRIFEKKLESEQPNIVLLINNAGYGKIGPFDALSKEEQIGMIDLNVKSLTLLTHICLPYMHRGSSILQVASSIAFSPAPYFAVYAATKSYVLSFSIALNFELKDRGIACLAVCPGPVATEFFTVAADNKFLKNKNSELATGTKRFLANPQEVVKKSLKDLQKKKKTSVYGIPIKVFTSLAAYIPQNFLLKKIAENKLLDYK